MNTKVYELISYTVSNAVNAFKFINAVKIVAYGDTFIADTVIYNYIFNKIRYMIPLLLISNIIAYSEKVEKKNEIRPYVRFYII